MDASIAGAESAKLMLNYTKIALDEFIAYKSFGQPENGDYDCTVTDGEVKKYTGTVFEAYEVTLEFDMRRNDRPNFTVAQTFLYSDEIDTEYDTFMAEIQDGLGFEPVYIDELIDRKGIATIKTVKVGGKSIIKVEKFVVA